MPIRIILNPKVLSMPFAKATDELTIQAGYGLIDIVRLAQEREAVYLVDLEEHLSIDVGGRSERLRLTLHALVHELAEKGFVRLSEEPEQ